jgi:hypothetical protein
MVAAGLLIHAHREIKMQSPAGTPGFVRAENTN